MQLKKVDCFEGTRFYVFSRSSRRLSAGYCILRRGMLFVLMRKESFGEKVAVYIVQDDHALG